MSFSVKKDNLQLVPEMKYIDFILYAVTENVYGGCWSWKQPPKFHVPTSGPLLHSFSPCPFPPLKQKKKHCNSSLPGPSLKKKQKTEKSLHRLFKQNTFVKNNLKDKMYEWEQRVKFLLLPVVYLIISITSWDAKKF